MPGFWDCGYSRRRRTWRDMNRYDRKQWHRDEAIRIGNGLKPRSKP